MIWKTSALFSALTLLTCLTVKAQQPEEKKAEDQIVRFEVGSFGTNATAINAKGEVTGWYANDRIRDHGFIRSADGKITKVDVGTTGTFPTAINDKGEIAGWFYDPTFLVHGFLREDDGKVRAEGALHYVYAPVLAERRSTGRQMDCAAIEEKRVN